MPTLFQEQIAIYESTRRRQMCPKGRFQEMVTRRKNSLSAQFEIIKGRQLRPFSFDSMRSRPKHVSP